MLFSSLYTLCILSDILSISPSWDQIPFFRFLQQKTRNHPASLCFFHVYTHKYIRVLVFHVVHPHRFLSFDEGEDDAIISSNLGAYTLRDVLLPPTPSKYHRVCHPDLKRFSSRRGPFHKKTHTRMSLTIKWWSFTKKALNEDLRRELRMETQNGRDEQEVMTPETSLKKHLLSKEPCKVLAKKTEEIFQLCNR